MTDTLDLTLDAIQHSSTDAFVKRDFEMIKDYLEVADDINNIQEKFKQYMEQLRVNIPDEVLNDANEEIEDFNDLTKQEYEPEIDEAIVIATVRVQVPLTAVVLY